MRPRLISMLVASLLAPASLALAQEGGTQWSGSASLGAGYVDDDARDPSKLNEYRDLGSELEGTAGFELRGRGDRYYFNGYGENLGRDDQYLDFRGGSYGVYKYRLYSDQLRHNFGSGPGALSPFSGIGGATLTATLPNANVATWNTFDHSYKRRDWGGMAEWQATSPWYFRVEANEVKREGINVFGGANGTSPGNGFTDLPAPIDYSARNLSGEVGYSTRRGHLAVNLMHSKFENDNEVLRWNNGFFANGLDTTVLPPDNQLTRLGINGNLRQLPWSSTLAGRLVFSQLTNDVAVQTTMLHTGGLFQASNATPATFSGDVRRTNLALSFSSRPTEALDTRAYLDYAKEDNHSTPMSFPGTALTGGTCGAAVNPNCEPELYHYKKTKIGAEGGYRLTRANRLSGGAEYADIKRERIDFPETKETRVFAQWKNSSVDWVTGRVKYQILRRSSDFNPDVGALSGNPMDLYVRRFDVANVSQNLLKLGLDVTPAPLVDLGLEVLFKHNDYADTVLGRTDDERQEYYASVAVGDPKQLRGLLFVDYERVTYNSFHRVGTGNPDPATPPTATTFNWSAKNEDNSWQIGMGVDWMPRSRLTLKGSLIYAQTEGSAEFSREPGAPTTTLFPINNFDNTRRTTLNLKAVYEVTKHWELTGGYAHEKYRYSDIGYDNTRYVTGATSSAGVVTGQFSFQPYTVDIVYGLAKYKF